LGHAFQLATVQREPGRGELTGLPGVCIVDEIDLFLHPEWQRVVIKQVAEAFPKLQFLFSTHSPIVAGTLHPANIFVLDDNKVEQYRENIYGLTPNQILTSSYFGLDSTRAPGTGTLNDLARRSLGLPDESSDFEQADPDGVEPQISDETRAMFRRIAAQVRSESSKPVQTSRKKGAKS